MESSQPIIYYTDDICDFNNLNLMNDYCVKSFLDFIFLSCLIITGLGFGICVSVFVVTHTVYNPMIKKGKDIKFKFEDDGFDEDDYRYKYFEELDNIESRELSEEELAELKNKVLNEETPKGEVIFYYNKDSETFYYYCESKEIPNNYLDAVARHYVCLHDCKSLYVDTDDNANVNLKSEVDTGAGVGIKDNKDNKDTGGVFASFKNYNNIKISSKNNTCLDDRCNRYTYKGKLEDYEKNKGKGNGKGNGKGDSEDEVVELDFSSFKKMVKGENEIVEGLNLEVKDKGNNVNLGDGENREDDGNISDNSWTTNWWYRKKVD